VIDLLQKSKEIYFNAMNKEKTAIQNNKFLTSWKKKEMRKRKWKKVTHLAQAMIEFRDSANL
jgi:hypothetical protein